MSGFLACAFIVAIIAGFIRGLTDDRPSFWRGFGEGLAGRGKIRGGTYFFLHDYRTGLGIGTRIDDELTFVRSIADGLPAKESLKTRHIPWTTSWYRSSHSPRNMPMHDTLSGRAAELAHLTDLIRTSLSLADSAIPPINAQLDELAAMGIDNLEIEGPLVYSRAAGYSPAFDDARVVFAAAIVMPGGLGCTLWDANEHAERYGQSHCEPPHLRERFVPYDKCPPIVRATLPAHAPKLLVQLLQSFSVLTR